MYRCLRSVRSFVSFLPLLAAGSLVVLPVADVRGEDPAPTVEVLLRGGSTGEEADASLLSPSAAFELRAATTLAAPDKVGQPVADSPLVLTPPLAGTFRWTSRHGGVFTPTEPPPLGTTYKVALRPGLTDADGQPVRAEFRQTFHTPPLEVRGTLVPPNYNAEPSPGPRLQLLFNAAVDPDRVAPSLSFRNPAGGPPVAAVVTPVTDKDLFPFGPKAPQRTWRELFIAAHTVQAAPAHPVPAATAINRVIVTPAAPLPPGKDWQLVAVAGLPAADGATLPADVNMRAGDVDPFEVTKIAAVNDGAEARKLVVRFSKGLDKSVTTENIGQWLRVSPEPANLKIKVQPPQRFFTNNPVVITGDFETDQEYGVTVGAGVPSTGKFYTLAADKTQTVQFVDETPQIAFSGYSVDQLGAGRRDFALSARNAAEVRLRVKLVSPEQVAQAQVAYDKFHHDKNDGFVDGKRLDFEHFPGKVVYEKTVTGSTSKDKPATVTLHWDDILGARRNGMVLLEAEQTRPTAGQKKRAGAQVLVQVTDLGVVWKTSPANDLLAYVFSMADASPVKASVHLLDAAGKPLAAHHDAPVTTRADGVAYVPVGTDKAAWLLVTAGDDCHILPFTSNGRNSLGLYRFHLPQSAFPPFDNDQTANNEDAADSGKAAVPKPPRKEILLFSERGVYKPGEEAHIKAIVREWRDGALADLPTGTPATLRAFDAKGRRFWQKDSFLSAAGSLSETVPLPKSGLGHYRVEIAFDGKKAADDTGVNSADDGSADAGDDDDDSDDTPPNTCRFQMQEYTPNAFLVKLAKPAAPPVGAGPVTVGLAARYYMGKTLSHARTVWSLKAEDSDFLPEGFEDYVFGSVELDNRFNREAGELALDGQGALSDKGELTLTPQIVLNTASPTPRRVRLQASVTDQDQQTVTARAGFTVHSSDFYLGVRHLPEVIRAGDPLPLEVVAVGDDEQPRPEPVKYTAKLIKIEWRTNRVANDSGNSDYNSKADMIPIGSVDLTTTVVRRVGKSWEPASEADALLSDAGRKPAVEDAPAATPVAPGDAGSLVPKEPGEYVVILSAQDAAGHRVQTATTFDALGDKEADWGYRNAWQLPLVADRAEYHPGDTALILVKTPISGKALVTVEREGVSRAFVADIAKEHPVVQVPIRPGDAPNMYVSVVLLRGSQQSPRRIKEPEYRAGCVQLLVPKTDTKLAVEVHPEKPAYQPGDEADVQVTVTDETRRPAPGAEVTLYAVDKGVLSLTGYQIPNAFKAFYHPRPLDVETGLTLPDLMSEDPEDLNFSPEKGYAANKGYLVGGGGEVGRSDRLRQNFIACAYWNATLVTDAEGRVTARFPTPDSLTEYAVMAVVHEGGRFGTGQGEFKVNKPLMLEPALPRFGNVGDHLDLRAVVHNQSPVAGDAEVTLDLDDKAAVDGANTSAPVVRRLHLAPGESRTVDIPVVFTHTGEASWTWQAQLTGDGPEKSSFRDSVRSTLTVDHPTPRRTEIANTRVDGGRADDLLSGINPEVLEGEDGIITVSVSTSRLGELREGVDALLHYPYGCVEQTTSSMLPWLALKDFRDALPALRHTPQQTDEAVARGVNRLIGMQTESGGLAYWPDVTGRDPHPWGSAYGGLGLALAKRAGYFVPAKDFDKLCSYLSELLRSDRPAAHDTYHEHDETDRCLALYALALAGKGEPAYYEKFFAQRDTLSPEDRTLLALAVAEDKGSADMIRALLQPGPLDKERPDEWNEFASTSVVDGMRLLAWCRFQPQGTDVEARMTRLLDDRTGYGTWETTQGNAWAVLAMAAYAHDVEKPSAMGSGTVALGGVSKPFELQGKLAAATCEFPLDANVAAGKEKLALTVDGKGGRYYVQTKVESRPRGDALTAAPTNGQGGYIIRRRYEKLGDDGSRAPAEGLRVGDRVLVTLEVEAPDRASYVAVNDPLPAVLEAVNPDFKTSGAGGNAPAGAGFSWWVSDFHELRADRAVFFCDRLFAGHFQLQYLARVRAAGKAIAPAAKIEEMYHPDRYAETVAASLNSKGME